MISALVRLGLKKRKTLDEALVPEEIEFATWHSDGKGSGDKIAPQLNRIRYFSLEELKSYTNNFSTINLIGEGGFGKTYKGYHTNGVVLAIKRAQTGSLHGIEALKNEIELLSRVHHKNLVNLLGFCFEQGEQMLVYDYISKGTLRDNLDGQSGMYLDWTKRLQIALDSARGLAYLHEVANPQIIHGEINTINILLDENLNAKVTNFYVSKLNREKKELPVETTLLGKVGYLDPEQYITGKFSEKTDVFKFGVVMLKLMTGRHQLAYDKWFKDIHHLALKVKLALDHNDLEYYGLREFVDPKIVNQARNIGLRKFVQLALACMEMSASNRPSMSQVMKEIEAILQNNDESSATTGNSYAF